MRSTNLFILRGRVGQAPKAFNRAAKINVATDRAWTDAKGERREETDWPRLRLRQDTDERDLLPASPQKPDDPLQRLLIRSRDAADRRRYRCGVDPATMRTMAAAMP